MILYLDGVYLLGLNLIFESTELVGYYSKYIGNGREALKMKFCIVGTQGSAFLLYKLHKNLILQLIMLFLKLVISKDSRIGESLGFDRLCHLDTELAEVSGVRGV
jgi:hypothetical protein